MFQNVKVDIIYYKTHTDFEMEFNLCGCCRMRLLTDKCPDRKTAVHALARAVSRSKVILMVGSLFGDEGIIKLSADAISKELTVADNKKYGISGDEEIKIIKGSTPLITPEGYFGGCIIESGPQTMILLSDSKNIRKSIMTSLIHPYIKELCAMELSEYVNSHNAVEAKGEDVTEEIPAVIPVDDVTPEEPVTEETEEKAEFMEDTLLQQAVEDDNDLYFEETSETDDDTEETENQENFDGLLFTVEESYYQNNEEPIDTSEESGLFTEITPEEADDEELINMEDISSGFISQEDEEYEGINEFDDIEDVEEYEEFLKIQMSRRFNMPIAIVAIILLLLIAIVCYCIFYVPAKDGIEAADYLREIYNTLFG